MRCRNASLDARVSAHAVILQRVVKAVFITLCRAFFLVNIDPLCLSAGFVSELCANTHASLLITIISLCPREHERRGGAFHTGPVMAFFSRW